MVNGLTSVRKYLSSFSKKRLIDEIINLTHLFPQVKKYYHIRSNPQKINEILIGYKDEIKKEFFPKRGFGEARLSVATKIIRDYKKISADPKSFIDLMIYYVEQGVKYTQAYGDIDEPFYESVETMYDNALILAKENDLLEKFKPRAQKIKTDTSDIGWGFGDNIDDIFNSYYKSISTIS